MQFEMTEKPELKWQSDYPEAEPMVLQPIEYRCDDEVTIRWADQVSYFHETAPAHWYLRQRVEVIDPAGLVVSFDWRYWNGEQWRPCGPKQFATPEDAYREWVELCK